MTKAGRNDPCPCGSGKKFKKCCDMPKVKKIQATVLSSGSIQGRFSSVFNQKISANLAESKNLAESTEASSLSDKISRPIS